MYTNRAVAKRKPKERLKTGHLTAELVNAALAEYGTVNAAATVGLKIHPVTLYAWMKSNGYRLASHLYLVKVEETA